MMLDLVILRYLERFGDQVQNVFLKKHIWIKMGRIDLCRQVYSHCLEYR